MKNNKSSGRNIITVKNLKSQILEVIKIIRKIKKQYQRRRIKHPSYQYIKKETNRIVKIIENLFYLIQYKKMSATLKKERIEEYAENLFGDHATYLLFLDFKGNKHN